MNAEKDERVSNGERKKVLAPISIRLRLALVYSLVLAVTIALSNLLLYSIMVEHFRDEADLSVESLAHHIASTIQVPVAPAVSTEGAGEITLQDLTLPPLDAFTGPGISVQIITPAGDTFARSSNFAEGHFVGHGTPHQGAKASLETHHSSSETFRVYSDPISFDSKPLGYILVSRSDLIDERPLSSLRIAMLGVGLFSLLLAGIISWAVAGRVLRPVAALTQAAAEIAQSGSFSRRVPHVDDRDELGELARTLAQMLASLENAYNAQRRFVADASHELRTPLTAILGNLELLRDKYDTIPEGDRASLIDSAYSESERMTRLVSELLTLARADGGQKLSRQKVELDRLLLDVLIQARGLSLSKGVKVTVAEIDQLLVEGDSDRLKQLILCLVDNAIKYTPSGGQVSLGLKRDGSSAIVEVADNGIGIADSDLPLIFDRFYRADKARSREEGGSGLGLSIARWIAQGHGGSIAVKSRLGFGSTFTVRLPLKPVS